MQHSFRAASVSDRCLSLFHGPSRSRLGQILKSVPYSRRLDALVLFDIDGTLLRRAGAHHREALVEAIRQTVGVDTSTEGVPVSGMLDRDILTIMMHRAGMKPGAIRKAMPAVVERAQSIYIRTVPRLERKVCPGVRRVLGGLKRRGVVTGLVTGNLSRIGWGEMGR